MSTPASEPVKYRFSFGPWNINEGADPFGPETRKPVAFAKKPPSPPRATTNGWSGSSSATRWANTEAVTVRVTGVQADGTAGWMFPSLALA